MSERSVTVDFDAAFGDWWEKVCARGAAFLQAAVPRWGNAVYLWDTSDLTDPDAQQDQIFVTCWSPVSLGC